MEDSLNGPGGVNGRGMGRAERFEDEKRRIIESCFGKKDDDGSLLESYITHIRIIEDAAYPSNPPPPNASSDAKKPRVIIVAVRKSGRVRMHKARENANGTFSIGKTWMLDDLSAIKSFSGSAFISIEEEQQKQWAGGVGFAVTLGKPYYWQANTQKEKQFFIASLVKIYTKYTGGRVPELLGFDQKEKEQLIGVSAAVRQAQPLQQPQSLQQAAPSPSYAQAQIRPPPSRERTAEPTTPRQTGRDVARPQFQIPQSTGSSFSSQASRPPVRSSREDSPSGSVESGVQYPNPPSLRRLAGSNQSQDSFSRNDDSSSLPPRSRNGMNGLPTTPGRFQDRNAQNIQRAVTPDSVASNPSINDVPSVPAPLALPPERRRPPMLNAGDSRNFSQGSIDNIVPAPLASPGMRRDDLQLPLRSSERSNFRGQSRDTNGNGSQPASGKAESLQPRSLAATSEASKPFESVAGTSAVQSPIVSPSVEPPPQPEEEVRPGLGPMIKKKSKADLANSFLKAAKTANSFNTFKPRAGGAAERLRETQAKSSDGPDGITGVVPAPSLVKGMSGDSTNQTKPSRISIETPSPKKPSSSVPEVKISAAEAQPVDATDYLTRAVNDSAVIGSSNADGIKPDTSKLRDGRRPKPAAETMQKELTFLGVDSSIVAGRGGDLVNAWEQFGWVGDGVRTRSIDQIKDEVDREQNRVQAGGWLTRLDDEDDRIEAIKTGLDRCIDECDELDGLLTLYLVELGTLNEDIAYIEAQGQGLQVQTANQKLLKSELESLLGTISISMEQLGSLREASLESSSGLEQIENSLVMLFKAMLTIDPSLSISGSRPSEDGSLTSSRPGLSNSEIGSMRVLQEKKDVYRSQAAMFLQRLKPFLNVKFAAAIDETRRALEREKGNTLARAAGKVKLDPRNHDLARDALWKYGPLMLFSREVDRPEWEDLIKTYEMVCRPLYQDEFRDAVFSWKRIAKKPTGDESDMLFTSQIEKQAEGIATTARKLTVKRSQTLAKSLRSPIGGDNGSRTSVDKTADGRLQTCEVFSGILEEMVPIVSMEQNFIVEFFHITSLGQHDFPDAVAAAPPNARRGGDLRRTKVMEPNRDLAKLVIQSMEEIYTFFPNDIQALVDWCLQADPLQGVGVLAAIERKLNDLEESSQEYLVRTLQKTHTRLLGLFNKFLDEQIRAIEETKVKIKKRKGVIGFIRIFPSFSLALETMLASAEDLDVRETVNHAYGRINKTMFESLKVIARENPGAQAAGADPEDKEALNYEILLIENMNHYLEEVDVRSNPVLEDWKQNAAREFDEHMTLYLGAIIRRPLGKLLDFLESTESLMHSQEAGDAASKISSMPSHSRSTFKKVLASYDGKEMRKGIETLKRRVEKHFGDADDPALSRGLVTKVVLNCEKFYEKVEDRILTISRDVYEGDVIAEWARADVSAAFRK